MTTTGHFSREKLFKVRTPKDHVRQQNIFSLDTQNVL